MAEGRARHQWEQTAQLTWAALAPWMKRKTKIAEYNPFAAGRRPQSQQYEEGRIPVKLADMAETLKKLCERGRHG